MLTMDNALWELVWALLALTVIMLYLLFSKIK